LLTIGSKRESAASSSSPRSGRGSAVSAGKPPVSASPRRTRSDESLRSALVEQRVLIPCSIWEDLVKCRCTRRASSPRRPGRCAVRCQGPDQLRHAHALELAREGVPLNISQRQLGHTNLGTTWIYLQASTLKRSSPQSTPGAADDVRHRRTRALIRTSTSSTCASNHALPRVDGDDDRFAGNASVR
jgi:Phage integrase family